MNFLLDLLFPKTCFGCKSEGSYLCPDCLAVLDVLQTGFCLCQKPVPRPWPGKCRYCRQKSLAGLYFALDYNSPLVKTLIQVFKYQSVKELKNSLADLIITHFKLTEKEEELLGGILMPIPLEASKLRGRGFNQTEEIAKILAKTWQLPLLTNALIKTKTTRSQTELSGKEREENIKGAFVCQKPELVKGKKVFLVDDVYTTGATMEEAAKTLKVAGAKQVWGIVVARD